MMTEGIAVHRISICALPWTCGVRRAVGPWPRRDRAHPHRPAPPEVLTGRTAHAMAGGPLCAGGNPRGRRPVLVGGPADLGDAAGVAVDQDRGLLRRTVRLRGR